MVKAQFNFFLWILWNSLVWQKWTGCICSGPGANRWPINQLLTRCSWSREGCSLSPLTSPSLPILPPLNQDICYKKSVMLIEQYFLINNGKLKRDFYICNLCQIFFFFLYKVEFFYYYQKVIYDTTLTKHYSKNFKIRFTSDYNIY